MSPKHYYMVITTQFELEPLLEDYLRKYPQGEYSKYKVVFRSEGEHEPGQYSYIVVFDSNPDRASKETELRQFLDAYCKLHKVSAVSSIRYAVFPKLAVGQGEFYGNPDSFQRENEA